MERARAPGAAAPAPLDSAPAGRRDAALVAPIAGVVAKRHVVAGEKLSAEQEVLTLVDLHRLELAGNVALHEVHLLSPGQAVQAMMQAYLSPEHIAAIETGCPVSALGSEMPRQSPQVRRAATIHIKEMIDVFARQMPDWGQPRAHEQAMALLCALIGTTVIARAVDDPRLSKALCEATLKQFSPAAK